MTDTLTTVITEPGLYADIPEAVYHADAVPAGSLSVSGAKKLLPPYCPAIYRYERDHGRAEKRAFDFGHTAHSKVLGVGLNVVPIDAPNYKTKKAQEERDAAYAAGNVPLLTSEIAVVDEMAEALRRHPLAMTLLSGDGGVEQSAFWHDDEFAVWRRARFDRWTRLINGMVAIVDYKTATTADPHTFARKAPDFGYEMQAAWYRDAAKAVGLDDDAAFVFIVQDKNPPYLVSPVQLDDPALARGRARNRQALEIFRDCQQSGIWPGYSDDIETVSLPRWAVQEYSND